MLTLLYAAHVTSTGTGAITLSVAALSGSGVMRIASTGTESVTVDTTAALGAARLIAAGSEAITVNAIAGSGTERFAGSATETFSVPATSSGSGNEQLVGNGAESLTVCVANGVGAQRFEGAGSEAIDAPTFYGSSSNNQQGSGACAFAVPALGGSGSQQSTATVQPQGSGGGDGGFVRWGPLPTVQRKAPAIPIPVKKARIAGDGKTSVHVPSLQASGSISFRGGTGVFDVRISFAGEGSHVRPKVMGTAAMMAGRFQMQSAGFHDIRPIEEEEMALFLAAAA